MLAGSAFSPLLLGGKAPPPVVIFTFFFTEQLLSLLRAGGDRRESVPFCEVHPDLPLMFWVFLQLFFFTSRSLT